MDHKPHENGFVCPLAAHWRQHGERAVSALTKLEAMHNAMDKVIDHTKHLSALSDIRDTLLSAATGKDHVPTRVFLIVLGSLGTIVLGLVFVIVFLLTGEAQGWIKVLHR